jgi:hypothetical protein
MGFYIAVIQFRFILRNVAENEKFIMHPRKCRFLISIMV